jgi:hypothetical protein
MVCHAGWQLTRRIYCSYYHKNDAEGARIYIDDMPLLAGYAPDNSIHHNPVIPIGWAHHCRFGVHNLQVILHTIRASLIM